VSIFEIVVGDMVQLNIGDQVSSCFSHHPCRGSMYNIYTQFLDMSFTKLKIIFFGYIWGFETLLSTLSDVKDNIKIHLYVTLMIKIPSMFCIQGHSGCVLESESSITSRYTIDSVSALE
jgi:hypothetical protein